MECRKTSFGCCILGNLIKEITKREIIIVFGVLMVEAHHVAVSSILPAGFLDGGF